MAVLYAVTKLRSGDVGSLEICAVCGRMPLPSVIHFPLEILNLLNNLNTIKRNKIVCINKIAPYFIFYFP